MLRTMLRREIRKVAAGEAPGVSPARLGETTSTYCHDSVIPVPMLEGEADRELARRVGREITAIVVHGAHQAAADRVERIRAMIRDLPRHLAEHPGGESEAMPEALGR